MEKRFYDKCLKESKEICSYEDLYAKYKALSNIISIDRAFANQVFAGSTAADMNQLFSLADELEEKFSYNKAEELMSLLQKCKGHWKFIIDKLDFIKENNREERAEKMYLNAIKYATKPNDLIELDIHTEI